MPRGMRIPPDVRAKYVEMRAEGFTRAEACRRLNVSLAWAKGFDLNLQNSSSEKRISAAEFYLPKGEAELKAGPKLVEDLCPEALRGLEDIAYFAKRYFGCIVMPFQQYAVEKITELEATHEEEYLVINQAPGTGKSTFWTKIFPAWKTARDRRIRGLIGSATAGQAKWYVGALRDVLTNPYPITASVADIRLGIACDAEAALCTDYGRFRPEGTGTKWAQDGFFVELPIGVATGQKEPTWSAFGRSSAFLGLRVPIAVWDDAWDPDENRSMESRKGFETWWTDVAEARLEPGGLLILQMQRLDPGDICRYALDMGGTVIREGEEGGKKYHHIKFKAHYPELCKDDHGPDAQPYDPFHPTEGGCLLYPKRLGYAKLEGLRENNPNFEMVYQQEDVVRGQMLVDRLWINGGTDPENGEVYQGCIDRDRDLGEIPGNLAGRTLSIVTADPSPTNYWAIEWWIVRYDTETKQTAERYLIDLHRAKMQAPDVLDWNNNDQKFTGLFEEWQRRSKELGAPITHYIVENNAAQRFLRQYEHFRRWERQWGITLIDHTTGVNKADKDYGVQTIGRHYKYGRVRLPYRWDTHARLMSNKLVEEAISYPNKSKTDDCVMAHWFLEWNLPRLLPGLLARARIAEEDRKARVSWLSDDPRKAGRDTMTRRERLMSG